MQSLRTFDPSQLRHNIPTAPPPPPLPSPVEIPTFQLGQADISNNSPRRTNNLRIVKDAKSSHSNFLTTGSPYLKLTGSNTTSVHKKLMKTSVSLPTGELKQKPDEIPTPPPLPHLPIRRQPSELLREIRGKSKKRQSGHNLGPYYHLNHVETVEKRAFRVGRVIGNPIHVVTTQDLIESFNKRLLQHVALTEPDPPYPLGRVVRAAPKHVPKMKEKFSSKKKSSSIVHGKKRAPGKLKKSSPVADPEDELPRIPTPPPLLDNRSIPMKSKQQLSKKSAAPLKY